MHAFSLIVSAMSIDRMLHIIHHSNCTIWLKNDNGDLILAIITSKAQKIDMIYKEPTGSI